MRVNSKMMILSKKYAYFAIISFFITFTATAEDRIEMEATSIVGNKELPKMLYIVPWKNSELPDINVPPIESLIDDALAPVNRDALKRQIRYYQIYSHQQKTQSENQ